MAYITLTESKRTLSDKEEVRNFLAYHGVTYQTWDVPTELQTLSQKPLLSDEDKKVVLSTYQPQLGHLKETQGYIQNDMVCLCPETPQIETLLSKFDKDHYHTDDEVRFILSGRGIFGFEGKHKERFTIEVVGGDYIVIPANNWHWFTLGENRDIKAIRLFQDTTGWVPHYRTDPAAVTSIR